MDDLKRNGAASLLAALLMVAAALPVAAGTIDGGERLTIEEAVIIALERNPAMVDAWEAREQALAGRERAEAARGFQVRLDGRYTHLSETPVLEPFPGTSVSLGEDDTWLVDLVAGKVIYSGGRLEALVREATSAASAAEAFEERAGQVVANAAERAFLLLLAAQGRADAARKTLEAARNHLATAEKLWREQAVATFDVVRAEVEVREGEQEVIAAGAARETAHANLLQAMGLEEGDYVAVAPDASTGPRPAFDELMEQAVMARPELRALGWEEEAARAAIEAARGERFPSIALAADYLLVEPESPTQFNRWSVGATVTLPLLDGGRARAAQRGAEARQRRVRAARRQLHLAVSAEVRRVLARLVSADGQVTVAVKRLTQAEELFRLAEVRYREDVATATEIADALASLARAREGLTRARVDQWTAESELRLAVGVPVTEKIEEPREVNP